MTTGPDRVPRNSTGWGFTMASGGSAGCSFKLPLRPYIFSSTSLHSAHRPFHITFSSIAPPHTVWYPLPTYLLDHTAWWRESLSSFLLSYAPPAYCKKCWRCKSWEPTHVLSLSSLLTFCPVLLLFSLSVHFFVYQIHFFFFGGGRFTDVFSDTLLKLPRGLEL